MIDKGCRILLLMLLGFHQKENSIFTLVLDYTTRFKNGLIVYREIDLSF